MSDPSSAQVHALGLQEMRDDDLTSRLETDNPFKTRSTKFVVRDE